MKNKSGLYWKERAMFFRLPWKVVEFLEAQFTWGKLISWTFGSKHFFWFIDKKHVIYMGDVPGKPMKNMFHQVFYKFHCVSE